MTGLSKGGPEKAWTKYKAGVEPSCPDGRSQGTPLRTLQRRRVQPYEPRGCLLCRTCGHLTSLDDPLHPIFEHPPLYPPLMLHQVLKKMLLCAEQKGGKVDRWPRVAKDGHFVNHVFKA
ncbi:hypothetical protein CEXT_233051 [Caerostris extrusa]|uniref:Uncharacterized protein n=1 Tax=Caerostris extrusa TaxID=172846 RepID=A0AAV4XQ90_CAEEX|nr:hypothetical protein CEXT_233051 [Caerostris extrusa]